MPFFMFNDCGVADATPTALIDARDGGGSLMRGVGCRGTQPPMGRFAAHLAARRDVGHESPEGVTSRWKSPSAPTAGLRELSTSRRCALGCRFCTSNHARVQHESPFGSTNLITTTGTVYVRPARAASAEMRLMP